MEPVETALEAAVLVMQNGGSTVAAERSFTNILKGCHQQDVITIWRLDFIAATTRVEDRSSTFLRPVGPIGVNLTRASAATVLAEGVAQGAVQLPVVEAELERIKRLHSPYNRWVMLVTVAATAGWYSRFIGGDWGGFGIAFVAAAAGQFLRPSLQSRKLSAGAVTLICGVLSAMIAGAGLRLKFSQAEPATLIASVIYMVPGLPLINGFVDLLSQRHLAVGLARMVHAGFVFLVLAIAIALAHTVFL